MKSYLQPLPDISIRPDILRAKHRFGLVFGLFTGLAFVAATWGYDAILLSRYHAYQPWLKLLVSALICIPVGGLAGWLSAWREKPILSVLIWLAVSAVFAWLSTIVAFQIYPSLTVQINPDLAPVIDYSPAQDLVASRSTVAYMWTGIFGLLVGVLQLPLSEGAVFSASYGSKIIPVLVAMLVMFICGFAVDNLNNEPLRSPIASLYSVVQFATETRGQAVDPALAREMRRSTVKAIEGWLGRPYYLVVASFDQGIGQVHVYANFAGDWADCIIFYTQPSFCKPVSP